MTNDHSKAMVLRDAEGNYYVLPIEVMERARVPKERVAEVEAAIGEVTAYSMGGAVALSLRGGDFAFESGQDLSIGYDSHDAEVVRLYLEESFSFRVATPEAAVALRP